MSTAGKVEGRTDSTPVGLRQLGTMLAYMGKALGVHVEAVKSNELEEVEV